MLNKPKRKPPMETLEQHSTKNLSSSKAAEIYREDTGGVYYVCYHCGIHLDNIADTLAHIELHFSSVILDTKLDQELIVDVKYEFIDDVSPEVDSSQIEDIFVDCSQRIEFNSGNDSMQMEVAQNQISSSTQLPSSTTKRKKIYSDMEGHFEWKCLYCSSLLKEFSKLKEHLTMHVNEPLPLKNYAIDNDASTGKLSVYKRMMSKAQYLFKCILCTSEFIDPRSSRRHLRDVHNTESTRCIPCGREFVSTKLLADHMSTSHASNQSVTKTSNQQIAELDEGQGDSKTLLSQYNTFLCILCDKTFNGTFNLMQHIFVHFNLKVFRCTECPAKFQQQSTANDHMRKKHSLKSDELVYNTQCTYCSEKVENLFEFVTHTFTHHLDEGERNNVDLDSIFTYDCRFCFTNFTEWNKTRPHLLMHSANELPMALPTTNVRFFSDRAKSGLYRCEFLYNCTGCTKTLCGSFEARNHWITEHRPFASHQGVDLELSKKINHQKESFKCDECDKVFSSQYYLMKHIFVHFKVRPYTCTHCSKTFSVSRNAIQHMIKIHKASTDIDYCQLDCHYCKAAFTEEGDFILHMFNDHLYEHFSADENLDRQCKYECQYCKQIFVEFDSMKQHLQTHKDEMLPVLNTDERKTHESSINVFRHNVEFVYCCLHCSKRFRLPQPASEHAKYKHKSESSSRQRRNDKKITQNAHCDLCNITFITSRSMLNHRAKRHPETHKKDRYKNRQVHYCSTCGKACRDKGNLNQHEETHARSQSYTCDICNKSYRTKYYIRTHMLSHTNEKNFICDQCGRSFYSVSKLNTHNQIHENLKLKCDQCDKVFFTRYNLTKHKNTHNATKRKCKLCDNYFKSNNSYRTHMLLHTGVKKYACRYCDMTFAQSSGRRGHEKIRHHVA